MPSKNSAQRLRDILENIDLVEEFTAGLAYGGLVADTRTVYAVVRALEIVSEATRRLPAELKPRYPECCTGWQRWNWLGSLLTIEEVMDQYDVTRRQVRDFTRLCLNHGTPCGAAFLERHTSRPHHTSHQPQQKN